MTMSHARRGASVLGEFYNYKGEICQVIGVVLLNKRLQLVLDKSVPENRYGIRVPRVLQSEKSLNQKMGVLRAVFGFVRTRPEGLYGVPYEMAANNIAVEANFFMRNAEKVTAPTPLKHQPEPLPEHVVAPAKGRQPQIYIGQKESDGAVVTGLFIIGRQLAYRTTGGTRRDAVGHLKILPRRIYRTREFLGARTQASITAAAA